MRFFIKHLGVINFLLVALVACAPPPKVAVVERPVISVKAQTEKIGGSLIRIVQPGDTLHAIAFGAALNVNELAVWNELRDTSRLLVGQKIRLTKPINFKPKARTKAKRALNRDIVRPSSPSRKHEPSGTQPAKVRSTQSNAGVKVNAKEQGAKGSTNKSSIKVINYKSSMDMTAWVWPANGKIVGGFSIPQGRQGVDILGSPGQAVVAAKGGEVVYVGNGLKGYGNLVIIKHSDKYLSAYAHNQHIYVTEGQMVNLRQRVGSIGRDKKGRSALHFQIRKNGRPVNPLRFLPKQ